MTRSPSDLAADVRAALDAGLQVWRVNDVVRPRFLAATDALSELVALVETLTQERDIEREHNPSRVVCPKCSALLPCESCKRYSLERDGWEARAEAAEAALAEMRRALEGAAEGEEELATRARAGPDHMGAAIHSHAASILRALAAAGTAPDDAEIARIVRERDANDTGERLTIEELESQVDGGAPEEGTA